MVSIKKNSHFATITFCSDNLLIKSRKGEDKKQRNYSIDSAIRARNQVLDYAFNNKFTHFITLTLDDNKIDWHDKKAVINKIVKQFDNFRQRYDKSFRYILIPEYGTKNTCRLHFHGMIYTELTEQLSFLFFDTIHETPVFRNNWFFKNLGANQFIQIRYDNGSVGKYISKYMSKQIAKSHEYNYDRFYYCSKGLMKSDIILDATCDWSIEHKLYDNFVKNYNNGFSNNFCTKYVVSLKELERINKLL